MSVVAELAKKFLFSRSSDGFLSWIAGVTVLGVSLGVFALILVTSIMNGFEKELVQMITDMNGHVLLYSRGTSFQYSEEFEHQIQKKFPEVKALSASLVTELMISGSVSVSGAVLQGIQHERVGSVTALPRKLVSGRLPEAEDEIILGIHLAEKIGAQLGSSIQLVVPFATGQDLSPSQMLMGRVVGWVHFGMYEYDSKFVFMTLQAVQKLLQQPGAVTTFQIRLDSPQQAQKVAEGLNQMFEYPLRAKDWSQLNKNLFYAIQLEKIVIAILLTAIIFVAAFNIVSTLMMMIHDKSQEISILQTMGFSARQSFSLFTLMGLGIGAWGILLGWLSGWGLVVFLNRMRWIELPADIYYIDSLPMVISWQEIGIIVVFSLLLSALATFYPAWVVAKRPLLEGLRDE